jgi:Xaa-Pro aminopeptidase
MPEIHSVRRARAQEQLSKFGVDAALVTSGVNVRYLSGLVSSNAAVLLPASGDARLATDARYLGTAERDCYDLELINERDVAEVLVSEALLGGLSSIGFEDRDLTVRRHRRIVDLDDPEPGSGHRPLELVPLGLLLDELRMVKDDTEIELLTQACQITGQAFSQMLDLLRPGVTERQYAVALERAMVDLGAEGPAFATIVASGPNGAIGHHVPTDRPFQIGDLVTIDSGAKVGGYHADMTRTVAIGEVADWQREIYELVARGQAAGVAAARVGAELADVDAAARDLISSAGHGEYFTHGLGHGVGLLIHEAPWLAQNETGTLHDRVPFTIEPGIYLPGAGGVRIEDTLVVRAGTGAAGSAQSLTTITRELLVL